MKKVVLMFIFLSFLFAACGSEDEEDTDVNDNGNENTEDFDDSIPEVIIADNGQETPDEDEGANTPESFCYSGGAVLYEGATQFKVCPGDSDKFQKQLCKDGKWVDEGDCVSGSVTISSGSFKMGCNKDMEGNCPEDTVPVHEVALSSYVMDKFEVPVELFELCIAENVCTNDNADEPHYRTSSESDKCNIGNPERKNHPANCVTWYGAKAYCEWLGKRLPTEAQWENAAKSGKVQIYPWGNTPVASCDNTVMKGAANGCGSNTTSPIGSKASGISEQGIFDLSGNVSEYTEDWYEKKFYSTEEASKADTQGPAEPEKDKYKVIRGGSYIYGENHTRASFRSSSKLDDPAIDFGFRCVSSPK
ncbi:formylglycine-generating enzyme family protein [bacterium]|nr:formylglycine-generating enzyme family protein [bacterium]